MSILDLVPHDPPMVLLDSIAKVDEDELVASLTIRPGLPFFADGGIPSYVGIEYIAQAVSAFSGHQARLKGEAVRIGFLLGTRKLDLLHPVFAEGARLQVTVRPLFNDGQMAVFDGTVSADGKDIVMARVNVYQPDDPEKMIEEVKRDV